MKGKRAGPNSKAGSRKVPFGRLRSATRVGRDVPDLAEVQRTQQQLSIYSSAVEQSASALIITNVDGTIEYVNPAFTTITGYQRSEAIGRVPSFLRGQGPNADRATEVWSTLHAGQTWQGELTNECKDGERRMVDVTIWPLKNKDGQTTHVAVLAEDIHEHKRVERELEHQRSRMNYAFEAANDGIIDVDLTKMEAYFSHRFYTMLGLVPNELPPTLDTMYRLLHPEDREVFASMLEQVIAGKLSRFDIEFRLRTKRGTWRWIRSRAKIVEQTAEGKPARLVGTHLDINENKRFAKELESEKRKAEAASSAKTRFLANMSHELRTPLNSILGFARQMDRDPGFPDEHRQSLSVVNRAGEHLLELINDVLEMSKIEVGEISNDQVTFDLFAAMDSVEQMMRGRATAKGLDLSFERIGDVPRFIEADQRKLRQVLINLVGNAIKFTQNGSVRVRLQCQAENGRNIVLKVDVEDTGPGIADVDRDRIFEAFSQGGPGLEGTGLGLTISSRFVRLMGGEIRLESRVGQGSRFSFTVNAIAITPSAAPPPPRDQRFARLVDPRRPADGLTYRILIVDDNDDNRTFLRTLLEQVGFDVDEVHRGYDAIERCRLGSPHLVMMDLRMPDIDGYETTRRIRTLPGAAGRIPIVAISASVFDEEAEQASEVGCDGFVRKPFRESEVFDQLIRHLGVAIEFDGVSREAPVDVHARFAQLPVALRDELETAAELSDVARVERSLEEIRLHDGSLAEALEPLVRDFAHAELLAAVRRSA